MAKFQMVSNGEITAFMLDDVCLAGAVEELEVLAQGHEVHLKLEVSDLSKLQVCGMEEYERCKKAISEA